MEKANIGFKAGIIFEKLGETGLITIAELARRLNFAADETHSPPGGSHVRIRYTSNGETVCCISGKSDTTYQKDKR